MKVALALSMLVLATAPKGAKPEAVSITPEALKFGAAPPTLPAGAELAVLHGDPAKKADFAVRLKLPDGYKLPPHWHSNDEQLTIVSGTFLMAMGDKFDPAAAEALGPGAYHFLPAKAHHAAAAKGEVVVQINGMGPFDIHYLNPADDPTKRTGKADPRK
jgi:hypothetical protein